MVMENEKILETAPDEATRKTKTCCVLSLIPCKIIYFCHCVGDGLLVPYLNLFLMSTGLSLKQTGFIAGIRFLPGAFSLFLFGLLADYSRQTKLLMFILTFLLMIAYGVLAPLLPGFFYVSETVRSNSIANFTQGLANSSQYFIANNMSDYQEIPYDEMTIPGYFDNTDALTMNLVKQSKENINYGNQRVFAPIGFTIGTLIAGFSVDRFMGSESLSKYAITYFIFGPFTLIELISIIFVKSKPEIMEKKPQEKQNMLKVLYKNCWNPTVSVFLQTIFLAGCCLSITNSYIPVYLEELTSSESLIGVTLSTSSFFEILIFPFTARIQKALGHPFISFIIAIFSYAVRFLSCSLATSIWVILPFQTLNAFGYALFWSAAVEYIYEISSANVRQTMMSILNITYFSMGGAVASMGGGVAYDYLGGRQLFAVLSITCFVWSVFIALFYFFYIRKHSKETTVELWKEKSVNEQLV